MLTLTFNKELHIGSSCALWFVLPVSRNMQVPFRLPRGTFLLTLASLTFTMSRVLCVTFSDRALCTTVSSSPFV